MNVKENLLGGSRHTSRALLSLLVLLAMVVVVEGSSRGVVLAAALGKGSVVSW